MPPDERMRARSDGNAVDPLAVVSKTISAPWFVPDQFPSAWAYILAPV